MTVYAPIVYNHNSRNLSDKTIYSLKVWLVLQYSINSTKFKYKMICLLERVGGGGQCSLTFSCQKQVSNLKGGAIQEINIKSTSLISKTRQVFFFPKKERSLFSVLIKKKKKNRYLESLLKVL